MSRRGTRARQRPHATERVQAWLNLDEAINKVNEAIERAVRCGEDVDLVIFYHHPSDLPGPVPAVDMKPGPAPGDVS